MSAALVTTEEINLVKGSWSQVIPIRDKAGELFYNKLFELAPQVRYMFKGDMTEQSRKLMSMITVVVTKLDKLDDILPEVRALALRHNNYGTKPEHFEVVGTALVWTLSQGLADKWSGELETAWIKVYGILSGAMIEAMTEGKA